MRDAGLVLGSLIAIGAAASFVLRRLRLRIERPVRAVTAIVTRSAVALFTGIEGAHAAERGGWFFWSVAVLLGVLAAFSALLAASVAWLLLTGRATGDDEDPHERAWKAKREGDVTALVRIMNNAEAPSSARAFAARLLGRSKNPLALEPLAAALHDVDHDVRLAADDALRRLDRSSS